MERVRASLAREVVFRPGQAGTPFFDAFGDALAPNAATHPTPTRATGRLVVSTVVHVRLQTTRAATAVRAAIAAAIPERAAGSTGGLHTRGCIGTHPVGRVGTLSAIHVVLATYCAHVGALVQCDPCVDTCSVALFAARNQLFACLAAQLCQPVAVLAGA